MERGRGISVFFLRRAVTTERARPVVPVCGLATRCEKLYRAVDLDVESRTRHLAEDERSGFPTMIWQYTSVAKPGRVGR